MKMKPIKFLTWLFMGVLTAQAQLAVIVFPLRIIGQKAIVPVGSEKPMTSAFESVRGRREHRSAIWKANAGLGDE
jgi:hypothetical protein